jgi:hypothetical protein
MQVTGRIIESNREAKMLGPQVKRCLIKITLITAIPINKDIVAAFIG